MSLSRSMLVVCLVAVLAAGALGTASAQVGARAMGMGGAFVGLADDATATFYNPAALAFQTTPSLTFSYTTTNRDEPRVLDSASFITPFDQDTSIGLSYLRAFVDSFDIYNSFTQSTESFEWKEVQYWLSAGYKLNPNTAVGLNARWSSDNTSFAVNGIEQDMSIDTNVGFDVALFQRLQENVTAGVMIQNINEPEQDKIFPGEPEDSGDLPRVINLGAAIRLEEGLTAAFQIQDLTDEIERDFRFGAEKVIPGKSFTYALRAGWFGDDEAVTVGAGVLYAGWWADVAVVDIGSDSTVMVSLTGAL